MELESCAVTTSGPCRGAKGKKKQQPLKDSRSLNLQTGWRLTLITEVGHAQGGSVLACCAPISRLKFQRKLKENAKYAIKYRNIQRDLPKEREKYGKGNLKTSHTQSLFNDGFLVD